MIQTWSIEMTSPLEQIYCPVVVVVGVVGGVVDGVVVVVVGTVVGVAVLLLCCW